MFISFFAYFLSTSAKNLETVLKVCKFCKCYEHDCGKQLET